MGPGDDKPKKTIEDQLLGDDDGEPTVLDPVLQKRIAAQARADKKRQKQVPEGWDLGDLTNEEFWARVCDLEKAQKRGGVELEEALTRYKLESADQFRWVRDRFVAHHGKDPDFRAAMEKARSFSG